MGIMIAERPGVHLGNGAGEKNCGLRQTLGSHGAEEEAQIWGAKDSLAGPYREERREPVEY